MRNVKRCCFTWFKDKFRGNILRFVVERSHAKKSQATFWWLALSFARWPTSMRQGATITLCKKKPLIYSNYTSAGLDPWLTKPLSIWGQCRWLWQKWVLFATQSSHFLETRRWTSRPGIKLKTFIDVCLMEYESWTRHGHKHIFTTFPHSLVIDSSIILNQDSPWNRIKFLTAEAASV